MLAFSSSICEFWDERYKVPRRGAKSEFRGERDKMAFRAVQNESWTSATNFRLGLLKPSFGTSTTKCRLGHLKACFGELERLILATFGTSATSRSIREFVEECYKLAFRASISEFWDARYNVPLRRAKGLWQARQIGV